MTVSAILNRRVIGPGEDVRAVKVTITAGPKGAYLPRSFGDWDETCQSPFWKAPIAVPLPMPSRDAITRQETSCARKARI